MVAQIAAMLAHSAPSMALLQLLLDLVGNSLRQAGAVLSFLHFLCTLINQSLTEACTLPSVL